MLKQEIENTEAWKIYNQEIDRLFPKGDKRRGDALVLGAMVFKEISSLIHQKEQGAMLRQRHYDELHVIPKKEQEAVEGHRWQCTVCGQWLWSDKWHDTEHPFFHPYCKRCYGDLKYWKISKNEYLQQLKEKAKE